MDNGKKEQREGSGVAWRNDKKPVGSNQPDFRGELKINGVNFEQAVWIKVDRAGKKFLTMAYKPVEERPSRPIRPRQQFDDFDDVG